MDQQPPTTTNGPTRRGMLVVLWLLWLLGPATYGAAFVFCTRHPGLCNDPPNLLLAFVLMQTHGIAAVVTLALLFVREYRRLPESWLLVAYGLCLAGWLAPPVFGAPREPLWSGLSYASARAAAAMVLALPAAGCIRAWRGWKTRPTRAIPPP